MCLFPHWDYHYANFYVGPLIIPPYHSMGGIVSLLCLSFVRYMYMISQPELYRSAWNFAIKMKRGSATSRTGPPLWGGGRYPQGWRNFGRQQGVIWRDMLLAEALVFTPAFLPPTTQNFPAPSDSSLLPKLRHLPGISSSCRQTCPQPFWVLLSPLSFFNVDLKIGGYCALSTRNMETSCTVRIMLNH